MDQELITEILWFADGTPRTSWMDTLTSASDRKRRFHPRAWWTPSRSWYRHTDRDCDTHSSAWREAMVWFLYWKEENHLWTLGGRWAQDTKEYYRTRFRMRLRWTSHRILPRIRRILASARASYLQDSRGLERKDRVCLESCEKMEVLVGCYHEYFWSNNRHFWKYFSWRRLISSYLRYLSVF